MPRTPPKTKEAATASANFVEVTGRKFKLPRGYVIARANQRCFPEGGDVVEDGAIVLVPKNRASRFEEAGWVSVVAEPEWDCSARELVSLDGGQVPVLN